MFRIQTISSFDQPGLAPYRTLRRSAEHAAQGIFVAEGDKVVQRLLESHFGVESVVLPESRLPEFQPLIAARKEEIAVYLAEKKFLESLVGFEMFQGVLAIGKIPGKVSLDGLLKQHPSPRLFAAVDGLTNAENIGLLVRNCAAFGTQALIVGETCSSPFLRRAVRNSMGTIFKLPILELNRRDEFHESPKSKIPSSDRKASAASPRIRIPTKRFSRRPISAAIAAWSLAAKAMASPSPCWPNATRRC